MFTPARYIVLDDELSELATLVDALHVLGAPCIGIRFDPLDLPKPAHFKGLRVLFSDLHLVKAQPAGVQHYNTLAGLLDRCVPESHGPYLLVLWTSHEHERAALAARLEEILPASKKPIAVLALDKVQFRHGAVWDAAGLQEAIEARVGSMPQLQALLNWERDVLAAANETLAVIGGLVPAEQRTVAQYAGALDGVLSHIAVASAGNANARNDRKGAVTAALAPLLSDRIANRPQDADANALWEQAVTFPQGPELQAAQKARMNRMLHLAVSPAEPVNRHDWGAIVPLGNDQLSDAAMNARFGVAADHLRDREFKLRAERRTEGQLVVVRAGAACDQAQSQSGPIPLLLGLLVPSTALSQNKRSPAIHVCDEKFELDGYQEPVSLLIHARFSTTTVAQELQNWPIATLRLREQLLTTILVHVASHAMRPGTLRF
ncbi:hypothetical protein [Phyllobacterium sp. YR531]|uniref:hypothetical protein n=1 Tax=Phyllobacterium sp. YR531 TaxID=1144343 RepID=UPI00026F5BAB|nr:hypothetical protein [Phyllobacterium sp. YR531]EJN02521.1 hypothetical protein PMI41_03273 [Phyllobacterium sp. YR531]